MAIENLGVVFVLLSVSLTAATIVRGGGVRKEVAMDGLKGNPGLLLRINSKAFSILKPIIVKTIEEQVKSMQSKQMVAELKNGQISIKDIVFQRYQKPNHVSITLENTPAQQGQLNTKLQRCEVNIFDVDFDLERPGIFGPLIRIFRRRVYAKIFDGVNSYICAKVRDLVEMNLNRYLSILPTNVPMMPDAKILVDGESSRSAIDMFLNIPGLRFDTPSKVALLRKLVIDLALVTDPFITNQYAETAHVGAITFNDQKTVPFHPKTILLGPYKPTRSFAVIASDFVINSFLYSLFQRNVLHLDFHPKFAPELRDILQVPCSSQFCLGAVVPTFQTTYQGYNVAVLFAPVVAPAVVSFNNRVDFLTDGLLKVLARNGSSTKEVLIASLKMRKGYQIPKIDAFELLNPVLIIRRNAFIIDSDIDLPLSAIEMMVAHLLSY
ncbi:unnamed protein product [Soboliphyme baturini]|uniref:BPI2 domain-containing protein n=1 Tax=Soboliphyme baturini TaxID=241478 RepID=A0A183IZC2_9BILA|nr:unnamed protein product [Soboliphyme baturini]